MNAPIDCGIVAGRHPLPVHQFVFDCIENEADYEAMQRVADQWASTLCPGDHVRLFTTGFSAGLVAAIKAAYKMRDILTLDIMHYNPKTKGYHPQRVWERN